MSVIRPQKIAKNFNVVCESPQAQIPGLLWHLVPFVCALAKLALFEADVSNGNENRCDNWGVIVLPEYGQDKLASPQWYSQRVPSASLQSPRKRIHFVAVAAIKQRRKKAVQPTGNVELHARAS